MVESKQIKVDNWGIFFLQRLQQFYNKTTYCDLTLLFDDHIKIRVHRLVLNACTEYFQVLEKTCLMENDCLRMPSNLPSDIVIPIINFMYSGILDLNESSFDRLYTTAKLMNMSVLTKLLDAQKVPIKPVQKRLHATPISWHSPVKKIIKPSFIDELPETLPGRKLPIWKRKTLPSPYFGQITSQFENFTPKKFVSDEPPKPTRFDWPENDENSFDNAFDDISYESKPLILPSFSTKEEKSPKAGPSNTFEEIKKTAAPVKRSASPIGNSPKRVNLQDVKEYLKEHKIRSDFIDYEEEEGPDNDLQPFENDDSNEESSQNMEDTPNKSILKNEGGGTPSNKHVRFSIEGEKAEKGAKHVRFSEGEESDKKGVKVSKSDQDMSKHTKIIAEVLKKYPHLVKNNKNIKLKILAKGNGSPAKVTTPKQTKVSYMVMKPEEKTKTPQRKEEKEHICTKCEKPENFPSYHLYRQHLTEVHNEKQDSQMCMICGHISRKQNMLIYHKFVKHNIPPPAMYNFPKCKECPYVAMSQVVLQKHMATHAQSEVKNYICKYCDKKFVSETIYNTHIQRCHRDQLKSNEEPKQKEKIKILSDVKVEVINSGVEEVKVEVPTEPSSEAEALSNVASGIAASLGLVDTIVVLDDNQFILQSQGGNLQQNIITNSDGREYIIPDLNDITATTVAQTQPVDNNVLSQTIKTGITSTDELVMVLTDHDYGDGNNAVITDNNIVVLYSHPVQTQAGTMMLTSEGNMIEVDKNYAHNIPVTIAGNCEESIEMIQQEINNQLDSTQEATEQQRPYESEVQKIPTINVQSNIQINPPTILTEKMDTKESQSFEESSVAQIGEVPQETGLMEVENEGNVAQLDENTGEMVYVTQNKENVAQSEVDVDQSGENTSHYQENMEQCAENVSQYEENVGQCEENVDQCEENVGQYEANVALTEENAGQCEENVGQCEENVDQCEENVVQSEENLSQCVENVGQCEDNVVQLEEPNRNEDVAEMDTMTQNEENVVQFEEQEVSVPQVEENIPEEQEPQNEEYTQQIDDQTDFISEEDNFIQSEENIELSDVPGSVMEVNETIYPEAPVPMEENILQNEEPMQTEENVSQIEPQEISTEAPQTQNEVAPEPTSNEENDPTLLQNEETSQVEHANIEETEGESSNLNENIQNENAVEEENVPYIEEERLPIDASIEQIGDIPQNEENDSSLHQTEISPECASEEMHVETAKELEAEQINNDQETADTNEKTSEEVCEDKMDTQAETNLPEEPIQEQNDKLEGESQNDVPVNDKKDVPVKGKNDRIMKILDDWDDGESDSQQSYSKSQQNAESSESIKKLIDDWEEEEDT